MVDVQEFLDEIQNYIESRLVEESKQYYQKRPTADTDYYDAEETAEKAMWYITISGRMGDIIFDNKRMINQNNAERGIRNKVSMVQTIVRELNE